jgi:hypothetical protein
MTIRNMRKNMIKKDLMIECAHNDNGALRQTYDSKQWKGYIIKFILQCLKHDDQEYEKKYD